MKVYAIVGYDQYYPVVNNIIEAFLSEEDAMEAYKEQVKINKKKMFSYDFIDVITIDVQE